MAALTGFDSISINVTHINQSILTLKFDNDYFILTKYKLLKLDQRIMFKHYNRMTYLQLDI